MTTVPDLEQAYETFGGVLLVYGVPNPHPTSCQKKKSKKTKATKPTNYKKSMATFPCFASLVLLNS